MPTTRRTHWDTNEWRRYSDVGMLYEAEARVPLLDGINQLIDTGLSAWQARQQQQRQAEQDRVAAETQSRRAAAEELALYEAGARRGAAPGLESSDGRSVELRGDPRQTIGITAGESRLSRTTGGNANADLRSFRQLNDDYYVDEAETPLARAARERDAATRRSNLQAGVQAAMLRRIASGDETAVAEALAAGVPASEVNAARPRPEPKTDDLSPEDRAYQTTLGRLRAEQKLQVGQFRPRQTGGGTPQDRPPTVAELGRYADGAIAEVLSVLDPTAPGTNSTTVYNAALNQLRLNGIAPSPALERELRARAQREFADARDRARQQQARERTRSTGRVLVPPPR